MTKELSGVWIVSAPDDAGTYHLALEVTDDHGIPLDTDQALAWGRHILWAVNAAEHDAAVVKQLKDLTGDQAAAAQLVKAIRADRAPSVRMADALDVDLIPGVSAFTGQPFLHLKHQGAVIGQWTMDDAREHALAVLQALENLTMDTAYLRVLETKVGLTRGHALAVVSDLGRYRNR